MLLLIVARKKHQVIVMKKTLLLITSLLFWNQLYSSESLTKEESANDFLYRYFDLDPTIKKISPDVQHLICAKLKTLLIVPQVLKKPHRTHQVEIASTDQVSFSNDDSHLIILHRKKLEIVNLNLDSSNDQEVELITSQQIERNKYRYHKFALNHDQTKLAIFEGKKLLELTLKDYKIIKQEMIEKVPQALNEEPEDPRVTFVEIDGNKRVLPYYSIRDACYKSSGELILATSYKEVLIVSPNHQTIKRIVDKINPFNPYRIVINPPNIPRILTKNFVSENKAKIAQDVPKVVFYPSEGLVLCDYEKGTYTTILEEDPSIIFGNETLSADGNWLSLKFRRKDPINLLHLSGSKILKTTFLKKVEPFDLNGHVFFSPDNKFFGIIGTEYSRIFHTQSLTCIAIVVSGIKARSKDSPTGNYSPSGNFIAFTDSENECSKRGNDSNGYGYDNNIEKITIWHHNPLWNDLHQFYHGRLRLEQALLIIFLRSIAANKTSLETVAQKYNLSKDTLTSYLKGIYDKIKNEALKTYISRQICCRKKA